MLLDDYLVLIHDVEVGGHRIACVPPVGKDDMDVVVLHGKEMIFAQYVNVSSHLTLYLV